MRTSLLAFLLAAIVSALSNGCVNKSGGQDSAPVSDARTMPASVLPVASMDADPEAKALLAKLQAMKVSPAAPHDDFNSPGDRSLTGPVTVQEGVVCFPEDRSDALYIYYGAVLPKRGRLSLDFRVDRLPKDHHFMTLCEAGTGGNTKFTVRLGMDRRVTVAVVNGRENIQMLGEPVMLGKWHQLRWWYAPEGAVLQIDGVIQDYSTDYSVPYAVGAGDAFYLGDQPWWDGSGHRVVFYPLDNFVGYLDNLALDALQP